MQEPTTRLLVLGAEGFLLAALLLIHSAFARGLLCAQLCLGVADRVQLLHESVQLPLLRLQHHRALRRHGHGSARGKRRATIGGRRSAAGGRTFCSSVLRLRAASTLGFDLKGSAACSFLGTCGSPLQAEQSEGRSHRSASKGRDAQRALSVLKTLTVRWMGL